MPQDHGIEIDTESIPNGSPFAVVGVEHHDPPGNAAAPRQHAWITAVVPYPP